MKTQFSVIEGGVIWPESSLAGAGAAGREPAIYDFRKPEGLPKSQARQLYGLLESFLRAFESRVSTYLRFDIKSRSVAIEQQPYSEFLAGLPQPTCLFSLGLKPYPSHAILELSPRLVFPVLEILLGAKASGHAKVDREITEIERHVLGEILQLILVELRETWKQFTPVDFSLASSATNPQTVPVLLASELVVTFTAEIQIGAEKGLMNLAMPAIAIKMMRSKLEQQKANRTTIEDAPVSERTLEVLKRAKVEVEARIQGASLLIRDLLDLESGQVIAFAHRVDRPVDCVVNGQQVFKGEVVALGNRVGFQIAADPARSD